MAKQFYGLNITFWKPLIFFAGIDLNNKQLHPSSSSTLFSIETASRRPGRFWLDDLISSDGVYRAFVNHRVD